MLMYLGCVPLEEGIFWLKSTLPRYMAMYLACVYAGSILIKSIRPKYKVYGHVPSLCIEKKLLIKSTRPKYKVHGHVLACVLRKSFLIKSTRPKYKVHAHVLGLCTSGKYTTKVHAHVSSLCTSGKYTTKVHGHVPACVLRKSP